MSHLLIQIVAWMIALAWLYKLLETARGLPTVPDLQRPEFDAAPAGNPWLAVIVPARNEAANIAACLESLLGQDYARLRIVGVDDRSSDATGEIMDKLAAANPGRIEALHIAELPTGWLGKTHAMAVAAREAMAKYDPEYLLFTDADVIFRADAIRRSVAQAVTSNADHFVLMPTLTVKTAGEAMVLSYLQVMGLWAVRPWRVADARAKRDAIGVGAFNLVRAAAYQQVGGFDAAPMEILEDLYLGRRIKRAGLRQRVAIGPGMVSVHWAAGAMGIVRGLTKNLYAVFRFRWWLLLAAAAGIALVSIAPVLFAALPGTRLAALLALASAAGLYGYSARVSRIPGYYAVFLPVAAAMIVFAMVRSMLVMARDGGVTWRGTFYPLAELRIERRAPD